MSRTIALLTDFGTTDTYVGVMKGVVLGICPDVQFVDLTHAIQPQNVRQAAFALLNSYRYFPAGTIFLVVVDPGVGSSRRAIAVRVGDYTFVAPDNGVLSYVLREWRDVNAVQLENPDYRLWDVSTTFHGRDIFAPAAAHLAAGVPFKELGSPLNDPVLLPVPPLVAQGKLVIGEVFHIDHFGSAVTSIGSLEWDALGQLALKARFQDDAPPPFLAAEAIVTVREQSVQGIHRTYAEVAPDAPLALVGSSGYLELAVNGGSFSAQYRVHIGDPVVLQIQKSG